MGFQQATQLSFDKNILVFEAQDGARANQTYLEWPKDDNGFFIANANHGDSGGPVFLGRDLSKQKIVGIMVDHVSGISLGGIKEFLRLYL